MNQSGNWGNLRTRIVLVAAAAVFVGFAVMVGLIVKMSYSRTEEAGYQLAQQQADGYARQVQDKLAVLEAFLAELDDAATRCAAIAAELGMQVEATAELGRKRRERIASGPRNDPGAVAPHPRRPQ